MKWTRHATSGIEIPAGARGRDVIPLLLEGKKVALKGQCHEIFCFRFFS
jgi:hypothetical protein